MGNSWGGVRPGSDRLSYPLDRQKANPYWAEIEHCHNFSRSRLYALLREMGFEPVR
jgi:hypothetical protein